jgi:hypothetical protein
MKNKIKRADFTSISPGFLIKNKDRVNTFFGGLVSIFTILILLLYFSLNLISMFKFEQDSFETYADQIPRDDRGYTQEISYENLDVLPNIKVQMLDRDKVKYF